jgi:hypothetical protein
MRLIFYKGCIKMKKNFILLALCVLLASCYTVPSEIKENISPLIDEQLFQTASSIYWDTPDTKDRIRTENETPGVCMDYAIHFVMEWNKKYGGQTNSTAMIVVWNNDYELNRGTFFVEPVPTENIQEALASAKDSDGNTIDADVALTALRGQFFASNIKFWGDEKNQWGVSAGVCFLLNGDVYKLTEWIPMGSLEPENYLSSYYYFWHPSASLLGLSGKKIDYHAWVVIMNNDGEWFAEVDPGWWDLKESIGKSMVKFYAEKKNAESYRLGFKQLEINREIHGEMNILLKL